ncbi:MAG: low molecular weight protein-tyrosine-phosphatase [Gammaproteobacteria bacterium]
MEAKVKVLFVCMGNICRSPTAEGVFRQLVQQQALHELILIDSAGTHAYHVGNPPDPRAQRTALGRGIDLSLLRARQVRHEDFVHYDYILAMDRDNLTDLLEICPAEHQAKLSLLLQYAPHLELQEVPDPYYGGPAGFERVLDMIEAASQGLLKTIFDSHLDLHSIA